MLTAEEAREMNKKFKEERQKAEEEVIEGEIKEALREGQNFIKIGFRPSPRTKGLLESLGYEVRKFPAVCGWEVHISW